MQVETQTVPSWVSTAFTAAQPQALAGFDEVRTEAREQFSKLGFPTTKNEEWKYTSTAAIARGTFKPATLSTESKTLNLQALTKIGVTALDGPRLVFINGSFSKELSSTAGLPRGVTITTLAQAAQDSATAQTMKGQFASRANYREQAFVALNTALVEDGAFISIADGVHAAAPIVVLFVVTEEQGDVAVYPRMLIQLGKASECTIVECYAGLSEARYLTTAVTEISVAEGAVGNHFRIQLEGKNACHVSTTEIVQGRKSNFATHSYSFGGMLVRNDVNPTLDGDGIESKLNGLSVLYKEQHVDNHTVIDHAKPHSVSHELYKGIYADASHGVFNGTIIVRPDAQKTNAIQSNQTLLLSGDAMIDAKPQLKIWADDVRCTHGATVGQLSDDALFYLRSRGIGAAAAKRMLIRAFASDLLEQVELAPLREMLEHLIADKLSAIEASAAE